MRKSIYQTENLVAANDFELSIRVFKLALGEKYAETISQDDWLEIGTKYEARVSEAISEILLDLVLEYRSKVAKDDV